MPQDQTVLFHSTVFGPIRSRRLGISLGINLLPDDGKICSFDCIYCEAGYNAQGKGSTGLPPREKVASDLRQTLIRMKTQESPLDVITFSGNGEPTLHPMFPQIIDDVIAIRDKYYPAAKISVLSNSTRITDPAVAQALLKVDNNILKLDSAIDTTMHLIDNPASPAFTIDNLIPALARFGDKCIIQTMLLRGTHRNHTIDNTTPQEISALISAYTRIRPARVMLYSIDRSTPEENLSAIPRTELLSIARKIQDAGIKTQVN